MNSKALVLFSGGQDSTTCLAWALDRYAHVETIGFDYGQRHVIELECRKTVLERLRSRFPHWTAKLGEDHMLDLSVLGQVSDTALTQDKAIAFNKSGLPNTFVPGRNLLFFTFASAVAYRRGLEVLVGGMCETDYSGYPDCRDNTLKSLQVAMSLGLDSPMVVETPLMWLDKAATWEMARDLGGKTLVELIQQDTHTCYKGDRSRQHDWGFGCSDCPACELRSKGYSAFAEKAVCMTYSVKEIFYTLQGEGANAGRPAVFCRFAGCNLWSGREEDRATATCTFCDTDFVGTDGDGGGKFRTPDDLAAAIEAKWPSERRQRRFVVLTGGEPLLQVDAPLVATLHKRGFSIAMETNGTLTPPEGIDWLCVSPKADSQLAIRSGQELKLVYPQPGVDPAQFAELEFENHYLQPMDGPDRVANTAKAIEYCQQNPQWNLSVQTHKMIGIR